jgi:hypothetical protein
MNVRAGGETGQVYPALARASALSTTISVRRTVAEPPTVGRFKDGRGEFYDQETFNGRAILVRFVISDITPRSCRFEQSFSDDGGKTWEVNWIAVATRVGDESRPSKRGQGEQWPGWFARA